MVLGLKGNNNRRSETVQIDYRIHIKEIKPWPSSQSLRSLRSVLVQWKNGECTSGCTKLVAPSLGSVIGEGKIEFNESFKLPVTLSRDMSVRGGDVDVFKKNYLEFNLFEPRRDKGQLLGTAIIDLAEYGVLKETLRISVPMNCKRSYRNTDQPLLFVKIQPIEKNRAGPSLKDRFSREDLNDNNSVGSVSALMNEEYAEEAEIASFSDDDVSSHSSVAALTTSLDSSLPILPKLEKNGPDGQIHNTGVNDNEDPLALETRLENLKMMQRTYEKLERKSANMSSLNVSPTFGSPVNGHASRSYSPDQNSLSTRKQVSPSTSSSSPSSLCNLDVNSRSRRRDSDHKNWDQSVEEKVAYCRNEAADDQRNGNKNTSIIYSGNTLSQGGNGSISNNPSSVNCDTSECNDKLNGRYEEADNLCVKEGRGEKIYSCSVEDILVKEKFSLDGQNYMEDEQLVAEGTKDQILSYSNTDSSERLENMQSVTSLPDSARNIGFLVGNHHAEVMENGSLGDSKKSKANIKSNDRKDAKIYPKGSRNASLDGKIEHLENKIKILEGELREVAATEAALYSVVSEHGISMSKLHSPARRLSRLYLRACKETLPGRRSGAAKSSVSGLVLVAKACGNDVPRLTFWLSNTVVLRTIISQSSKDFSQSNPGGVIRTRKREGEGHAKISSPLRLKGFKPGKNENSTLGYAAFGNWEDPQVFSSALEKVEAWIFSRIVESIWWQTLIPHMQPIDPKLTHDKADSALRKNSRRISSSGGQELGNLSLDIWKNAFRESCERLCPVRSGGHECGCLPMLPRLIMEQCMARLDVAMFNAILRKSIDEIPSDPVSDPISDPKVLPIPPGKSCFGAGAQLKTVIGTWSRWLTDLFGMDDDEDSFDVKDKPEDNNERQNASFKSFNLLFALSDLLMLPKDMLLSESIRKEVCPMFSAPLIKKILDNFVPDEFCPDPVPTTVFEALESENDIDDQKESVHNFPCIAAPIAYSPPPVTSIASIIGEFGGKSQLRRSTSSVLRKSYASDDELDELKCPLSSIFISGSKSSAVPEKPNLKSKESPLRYELLRDVWMNSK